MSTGPAILGWDIGGVNLKIVRLSSTGEALPPRSMCQPFEVQHAIERLPQTLRLLAGRLDAAATDLHAVTMTAELSQAFRTKREGVGYVLDALEAGFASDNLHVYTVEGEFVSPEEARRRPLHVAASNWAATARWVARRLPAAILIDIGSTTTDIIPIADGHVVALGHTDPERLATGELVYTGALRTPVEALVRRVPLWGEHAGVSAEGFAQVGDVHLWLGHLRPEDYLCRTPDGRPATIEFAAARLARVVCGDREMLSDDDITAIAVAVVEAQLSAIGKGLDRVRQRWPALSVAVTTGLGGFLAKRAGLAAGLATVSLDTEMGVDSQAAPAAAVASLLRSWLAEGSRV
jgi:(4-(4-[2-(gamma-L-glutamylamino)ethyl]phenoxymethyl)furan-2-yl)methanamine synthase